MKFERIAAIAMSVSVVGMSVCACSTEPEPVSSDINVISTQEQNNTIPSGSMDPEAEVSNFVFDYSGYKMIINTAWDESAIAGEEYDVTLNPSCAHQGEAYIYYLKGGSIEVNTDKYPGATEEVISRIVLLDDTITTVEGVYVGNTVEQVKAAYGEPAEETETIIIYKKGSSELHFVIDENGAVAEIDYMTQQV